MNIHKLTDWIRPEHTTLATFGEAQLVKHRDGKIELLGGSLDDRRVAREWCSHFLHNAAITTARPRLLLHAPC